MDENVAAESLEHEKQRTRRRRLVVVTSVLLVLVFCCCTACGLGMLGLSRHAKDVRTFTPIPAPEVQGEDDAFYARIAASRVGTPVDGSCNVSVGRLRENLVAAGPAEAIAFRDRLVVELARLDTQRLRDVCSAVSYGACTDATFLAFRAYLVSMGHETVRNALRDADALSDALPHSASCDMLVWIANSAHDEATRATRDAGALHEDLPRVEPTTRTTETPRSSLSRTVPRSCARFTCSARDLFDD